MKSLNPFEKIKSIEIEKPVDKIIIQLKGLIDTGLLKPSDRFPPERVLAEKFKVGRGHIREAIMKMEFYGLVKTSAQSGTYVAGLSIKIMDNIIADIVKLNKKDFDSLAESRFYLEMNSVKLACLRRTEQHIAEMADILEEFEKKILIDEHAVDDDMLFHIKIAAATQNPFIESMLLVLVPNIIKHIHEQKVCEGIKSNNLVQEHHDILDAIIKQDIVAAEAAMENHLRSWKRQVKDER